MKDNVNAVHVNLGAYQTNMGDLYIHRLNHLGGMNKMEHYRIFPKNIARVLEIQRLFLVQLEKKAGNG